MDHSRAKHSLRYDRNEILSHNVKSVLLEQSPLRRKEYLMEKVSTRTEDQYMAKDHQGKLALKLERNQNVKICGFNSEPKEHYRPLGDPITDPQELIFSALGMQRHYQNMNRQTNISESQEVHGEIATSALTTSKTLRQSNEYGYLKKKIMSSMKRVAACKLGSSFESAYMEDAENVSELIDDKSNKKNMISNGIDWGNLEIDIEKKAHFMALYNRLKKGKETVDPPSKNIRRNAWTDLKSIDKTDSNRNLSVTSQSHEQSTTLKSKRSVKAMEAALGIKKSSIYNDLDQKFFKCRNEFIEQEEHLSTVFQHSLKRMEKQRKIQFKRKFSAFNPGKNTTLKEDLRIMREKAQYLKSINDQKVLDEHPWYNEFITKVMVSPKDELSQYEQILIEEIQSVILDNKSFKKSTFVNIMKTVPQSIFGMEEIQRVFRFLKSKENISERDYLEAIHETGHK